MESCRLKALTFAAILFGLGCESGIESPLDGGGTSRRQPAVASNHITLTAGQTSPLANNPGTRNIDWESRDPRVASVSATGMVTGVRQGTTIVIARYGTVADTTEVLVRGGAAVTAIKLDVPTDLTVGEGESYPMSVIATDDSGNEVTDRVVAWTSNDTAVAAISTTGVVIGKSPGTATIMAASDGESASMVVVVVPPRAPVTSVDVAFGQVTLLPGQSSAVTVAPWQVNGGAWGVIGAQTSIKIGGTVQAAAIGHGEDGAVLMNRNVIWSSLTPEIATVTSSGVVTAVGSGTARLRATVETKTGEDALEINVDPIATVVVTLGAPTLSVGQTTQAVAVARDAAGALLTGRPVVWTSLDPSIATVSPTGLVTATLAGKVMIRGTVDTKSGEASLTVTQVETTPATPSPVVAGIAELPRTYISTGEASTPSPGKTTRVSPGEDLQLVFDAASPGDRIVLACGATFTGNFRLEAKNDGGSSSWITVQSDCPLPPPGTRTSPSQSFARLVTPSILPAIMTLGPAARWRLVGVEITAAPEVSTNQGLVALGCTHACETSLTEQPSDIILDRVYVHGTSELDVRRCVGFNGARLAVIDSYLSECHSTFDAQAVSGHNGPGPFKITNNYLEGSAENIAFGGADPSIPGLVPSDIEVRHNHVIKPLSWKGTRWVVKNSIEFKSGRRVLIDGNVIENSWPHGQAGYAFVLWSVNQQATCPTCVTEHLTIQNNVIRSVAAGFNLTATGSNGLAQYSAIPMNHVLIRNNMFIGLDNGAVGGNGRLFQISDIIPNLIIEHNTGFSPSNSSFIWSGNLPLPGHIIRNNLVGGGQYQLFTSWGQGLTAWERVAGPGSEFAGNVVALFSGGSMIPGNYGANEWSWIGLAGGEGAAYSATASLDDLAILPWSGYAKKGTDGTDPGANIAAVKAATAGVVR